MAHFLRDQQIENLSITEAHLIHLSDIFLDRAETLRALLRDASQNDEVFVTYIIRFDNKGYRVFSITELLKYFRQAKSVERVLMTVESGQSLRSNRSIGTVMELRLDEKDPNSSYLSVTSDDKDWVDTSFCAVNESLAKYRNRNHWVRTAWTTFAVQLIGVTLGFILSLWAATKIAPKLTIENAFIFSFLFVLLIFSNIWTYLNQQIIRLMSNTFPNIKFLRVDKEKLHWLLQAVISGIAGAFVLYIIAQAASFLVELLGNLISKSS
ncbi:MAG TPA: hypothetical protein VD885_08090 [Methylophilaceae bacterium]|nr:hypothetical protein [Methylophilaceae bacterium]